MHESTRPPPRMHESTRPPPRMHESMPPHACMNPPPPHACMNPSHDCWPQLQVQYAAHDAWLSLQLLLTLWGQQQQQGQQQQPDTSAIDNGQVGAVAAHPSDAGRTRGGGGHAGTPLSHLPPTTQTRTSESSSLAAFVEPYTLYPSRYTPPAPRSSKQMHRRERGSTGYGGGNGGRAGGDEGVQGGTRGGGRTTAVSESEGHGGGSSGSSSVAQQERRQQRGQPVKPLRMPTRKSAMYENCRILVRWWL